MKTLKQSSNFPDYRKYLDLQLGKISKLPKCFIKVHKEVQIIPFQFMIYYPEISKLCLVNIYDTQYLWIFASLDHRLTRYSNYKIVFFSRARLCWSRLFYFNRNWANKLTVCSVTKHDLLIFGIYFLRSREMLEPTTEVIESRLKRNSKLSVTNVNLVVKNSISAPISSNNRNKCLPTQTSNHSTARYYRTSTNDTVY